jgi:protein-arginine kinase activator protein McsA
MDPINAKNLKKPHICEMCLRHDPMVKNYSEDLELQAALRSYIEKETGQSVDMSEIAHLCDSCYVTVSEGGEGPTGSPA